MMPMDYTCKKCGKKITTEILPSNGICPDCRNGENVEISPQNYDTVVQLRIAGLTEKSSIAVAKELDGCYTRVVIRMILVLGVDKLKKIVNLMESEFL